MGKRRIVSFVALGVTAALFAAACGDSDEPGEQASVDEDVLAGVQAGLGDSSTTTGAAAERPGTIEEWRELWAAERAAVVQRIEENGWGLQADGQTILGPEGFTVDLSTCPANWSATEGLTDTAITYGLPIALSGASAETGNIGRGLGAILEAFAEDGAFTDSLGATRSVNFLLKDDMYDPARAIPLVDELLDSEHAFAITTSGSPQTLKTYDKLNDRCVPHLFNPTGHAAWGDPVNHPWTTGMFLPYSTETILWGSFIEERLDEFEDGTITVAALVLDNDAGEFWDSNFQAYIEQSDLLRDRVEYVTERVGQQDPTINVPMTNLAAADPDFFFNMVNGSLCAQSVTEAAENGMREQTPYLFEVSVCGKIQNAVSEEVVGDASDGWWVMGGGTIDFNSPSFDGEPWVEWARAELEERGLDWQSSVSFSTGVTMAWNMAQLLQIAGELEGGLTRANLITAARATEMTNPNYLPGIRWSMDGNADPYWIEGSDVSQWSAEEQMWLQQGDVIELSGETPLCAWDAASSVCR
ncbi:MAG: ABC transporter substrate-binding protein [Acidimicrobiia bacterium]|nr:ABC transporter substrate-binding protein [Acidimicrobiia bacterium]